MKESEPSREKLSADELANKLNELQAKENAGRGVSVIRSVITWLRAGQVLQAQLEASHDHDKIRNYPEIEALLKDQLFNGEELWRWQPPSKNLENK